MLLGMFYIICMSSSVCIVPGVKGGLRGVNPLLMFSSLGNVSHFCLVFCVSLIFVSIVGRFFGTWFFANGFLFPVKELGLLTNPSHWVRVLDVVGSYMYNVL
jgi:hypothetical protein